MKYLLNQPLVKTRLTKFLKFWELAQDNINFKRLMDLRDIKNTMNITHLVNH